MAKLVSRNQRVSGLLAMIVGVLMIVAGPVFADAGNGNGSDKKDEALPAVATASEAPGNSGNAGGNGNGSDKKDEAPAAAAEAPGNSGNAGGNGNGADNGKGNDKKDEAAPAESNGNGNGNGSDSSAAPGNSASEDKGNGNAGSASEDKGNGWESSPGQEGKGCDQAGQGSGPYASTCDGSPSQNGNGNGGGGGKPCAGCVGNADNKNPPGQMPNGSDPNNGYECDGNKGIGKGNPAHTSCTPGTPPPPPDCKGKKCGPPECPGNSCNPCPGNSCNPCPGNGKKCNENENPCPGNSCNPCPGNSCHPDCPGNSKKCNEGEEPEGPCDADDSMVGTQPCNGGEEPEKPCQNGTLPNGKPCNEVPDVVKPDVISRPGQPGTPDKPIVLGERIERPEDPTVANRAPGPLGNLLPFTGANLLIFLGTGLSLSGAGIMLNGKRK